MPKQIKQISNFSKGLIGNASVRNIPEDALAYSENAKSDVEGLITGINTSFDMNSSFNARVMEFLNLPDKRVIIGQDSSKQFKEYNVGTGSVSDIGSPTADFAHSMVPRNDAVYVGMGSLFRHPNSEATEPKWVGQISHAQFFSSEFPETVFDEVVDSSETSIAVASTVRTEVGDYLMTHDENVEIMKITAVDGGTDTVTVERGVGFTDASSHANGEGVSIVVAQEDDYTITHAEAKNFNDDGGHITLESVSFTNGTPAVFDTSTTYFYAFSYIYDGYQESPLITKDSSGSYFSFTPGSDSFLATIELNVNYSSAADFSPRITGINVYRADSPSQDDGPLAPFNFVRTLDLTSSGTPETGWTKQLESGFSFTCTFKDFGNSGASYSDNSGLPDSLEEAYVDYTIATDYSGYLFVGQCSSDKIPNAENYVFRSKFANYSVIDWTTDFAIIPETPTALAGFGGRLYVFTESSTYRINPHTMSIEDSFEGVGALNDNMVRITNYGMFHADEEDIYFNDGRASQSIGNLIRFIEFDNNQGWVPGSKTANGFYANIAFDPKKKMLLIYTNDGPTNNRCFAYDVEHKRWSLYTGIDMPSDTTIIEGELWGTVGTGSNLELAKLFENSTKKNWEIVTKDFDFGSAGGEFWVYEITVRGTGDFVIHYYKDGDDGTLINTTITDPASDLRKMDLGGLKVKSIGVMVSSVSGSDEIDSITIQYRLPLHHE